MQLEIGEKDLPAFRNLLPDAAYARFGQDKKPAADLKFKLKALGRTVVIPVPGDKKGRITKQLPAVPGLEGAKAILQLEQSGDGVRVQSGSVQGKPSTRRRSMRCSTASSRSSSATPTAAARRWSATGRSRSIA